MRSIRGQIIVNSDRRMVGGRMTQQPFKNVMNEMYIGGLQDDLV